MEALVDVLYAYVDGADLEDVEIPLLESFNQFVAGWNVTTAEVINNQYERTPDLKPDDLPEWDLGINVELERLSADKVRELVYFLTDLGKETGREFVIGVWDAQKDISEDWYFTGEEVNQRHLAFLLEQCIGP